MTQLTDAQIIAAEKAVQAAVDRGESAPVRFAILALSAALSAAESTGVSVSSIHSCIRGKQKTAGGYGWAALLKAERGA